MMLSVGVSYNFMKRVTGDGVSCHVLFLSMRKELFFSTKGGI